MAKLKIVVIFLLFILFIFHQVGLIYADGELSLPTTKINPGNFYYNFKRLWEKTFEYLNFPTQSKISYRESLLKTRLAELKYIVDNKVLSEVENSSKRFSYQAGILVDLIEKQNDEDRKKKIKEEFQKYNKLLDNLRDKYPANSSFWMLIQHDINTLNILSDRLK